MVKIILRLKNGVRRRLTRLIPARALIRRQYKKVNGFYPDLDTPRSLSEKLCWMKLNYVTPLQIECSDKITVRDYITRTIGPEYLVPLLFQTGSVKDIRPDAWKESQFVIKASHDSGGIVLCRDRTTFDWAEARDFLARRLRQNYYWETREPSYRALRPRLLVEQMLPSSQEHPLFDYKLLCVNGKFQFVEILIIDFKALGDLGYQQIFYNKNWDKMSIQRQYPISDTDVARPEPLAKMIELAEALAAPFPMCRVDMYCIGEQIYLGELTFYPSGGHVRFRPDSEERRLGDLLLLPDPVDVDAVLKTDV